MPDEPQFYEPADPTPREQCPCCDYGSLPERAMYLICPVCFWEDEGQDVDELDEYSLPNHMTLREGRENFQRLGACEARMLENVLPAEERKRFEHRPRQLSPCNRENLCTFESQAMSTELPVSLAKQLRSAVKRCGLQSEVDAIVASARPCFRITRRRGSRVKIGESHVGGLPHVPPGMEWPCDGGELMTFVAQINLADLTDGALGLPESGWLAFFVGGAEATGAEHAVMYVNAEQELVELSPPEGVAFCNDDYPVGQPVDGVFPVAPVKLTLAASVAPLSREFQNAREDDAVIDAYVDLHSELGTDTTRLRGYSPVDRDEVIDDPRFKEHDDWTLLLQVDSMDPVDEMCWWDNGKLAFLIREGDLAKGDFSHTLACLAGVG